VPAHRAQGLAIVWVCDSETGQVISRVTGGDREARVESFGITGKYP